MRVSMKFGSLTSASTPGGSGNGNTSFSPGTTGGGTVKIESVSSVPESPDSKTIYLVQGNVWMATTENITNLKFQSVEHLPPDPDPNVLYLIRKR